MPMPKRAGGSMQGGPPQSPSGALRGLEHRGGGEHGGCSLGPMGQMGMGPHAHVGKGAGGGDGEYGRGDIVDLGAARSLLQIEACAKPAMTPPPPPPARLRQLTHIAGRPPPSLRRHTDRTVGGDDAGGPLPHCTHIAPTPRVAAPRGTRGCRGCARGWGRGAPSSSRAATGPVVGG